ncbi:hypothetical protein [Sporosarcina sp. G11-34]|uniref:hypothetical protein n=1 Tax=Sporosarcina sp. G11-34 TaxID=2849605 RepID=UPI0022A9B8DE|nr:hypothetical protein [Sporosarcina sp. G11-34]MCZ2260602.1 hypothetical protein [Sporosarcina sp. G11-34]
MYNHYKHGDLNEKAKAAIRNEKPINNGNIKNTETKKTIENTKLSEIKRLSMRMLNDSIRVNSDDAEVLNDLFNFYKAKILKLSTEIESEDKAWALIQEIMQDESYLTKKLIFTRLEYRERLGKLIDKIELYVV